MDVRPAFEIAEGEQRLAFEGHTLREADGGQRVVVELISEGFGNARDNHYYSADLLQRVAPLFEGAKMYSNHLSQDAKRALGGLPRKWEDIVGRVARTWTERLADGRMAILGEAEIVNDQLWSVLRKARDIVGVSIDAAGRVTEAVIEGRKANVVTDITRVGSLDVVSEAGARGRFRELLEAAIEEDEGVELDEAENETAPDATETGDGTEGETPADAGGESGDQPGEGDGGEGTADGASPSGESGESGEGQVSEASAAELEAAATHRRPERPDPLNPHRPANGHPELPRGAEQRAFTEDTHPNGRRLASRNGEFTLDLSEAEAELFDDAVEERARALAAERLTPAIQEALAVARENFDRELTEALADRDERHERALAQRDQRYLAARLIEAAELKRNSERALKEEFFDAFYVGDDGKPDEQALREAVQTAIEERVGEARRFAAERVRGVPASGPTASVQEAARGPRPSHRDRGGELARDVDRELELT